MVRLADLNVDDVVLDTCTGSGGFLMESMETLIKLAHGNEETIEKIKTLHPGMGLVFGTAFKVPLLVNFPLPNPMPISTSLRIDEVWYN